MRCALRAWEVLSWRSLSILPRAAQLLVARIGPAMAWAAKLGPRRDDGLRFAQPILRPVRNVTVRGPGSTAPARYAGRRSPASPAGRGQARPRRPAASSAARRGNP